MTIACIIIGGVLVGSILLLGTQIAAQLSTLREAVPAVADLLRNRFGLDVQQWVSEAAVFSWITGALGYVPSVFSVVSAGILVLVGAIFLALDPAGHREGILQLVPPGTATSSAGPPRTPDGRYGSGCCGQLIAMLIIGVASAAVLLVLVVPAALALGLIAGLLEFIPYAGAILAYLPMGLAGLSVGLTTFWWVLVGYLAIQQIESNVLQPIIQQRTVQLPPVLTLFAIVGFAVIFGPLGLLLGVPLSLVLLVALKELYIEDVLGEPVSVPGERPLRVPERFRKSCRLFRFDTRRSQRSRCRHSRR